MSLEFKSYRIEKVGKIIKDSKKKHIWKLKYNNKYYEIKLMESVVSGMLRIMVQDDKIYSAKMSDDQKRRGIELEYEGLNMKFKKISEQIDFYANMNRFVENTSVAGEKVDAIKVDIKLNKLKPGPKVDMKREQEANMQIIEKSISESYLVYNKDFDDSDGDEGFENFGETDRNPKRNPNSDSGNKNALKDSGFNPSGLGSKTSDTKGSMQFSFKKPNQANTIAQQPPSNTRSNNYQLPQNSNREINKNESNFGGFKANEVRKDNNFLSFDFDSAKPSPQVKGSVQQRTNHKPVNFGWNDQPSQPPKADPFAFQNDFVPAPSPNVSRPQALSNSGVKNAFSRSPMDKGLSFNFNFAEDGEVPPKPRENPNSNSKVAQNPQSGFKDDPFGDFLTFSGQNSQPPKPVVTSAPFDGFGFEQNRGLETQFENFGFGSKPQPLVNSQVFGQDLQKSQTDNFNFSQPSNLKSSNGNFGNQDPANGGPTQFQNPFPQQQTSQRSLNQQPVLGNSGHFNSDPFAVGPNNQNSSSKRISAPKPEPIDPFAENRVPNGWNNHSSDPFAQQNPAPETKFNSFPAQYTQESDPFSNAHTAYQGRPEDEAHGYPASFGQTNHVNSQNQFLQNDPFGDNTDPFGKGFSNVNEAQPQFGNANFDNGFGGQDQFQGQPFGNFGQVPERKNEDQFSNFGFKN
jgi:hypothetical protein